MDLEELFENVEDITDPSLMDNILARLEEIQSEDEEFMQVLLNKMDQLVITWDQPWYQKSRSLTRPLQMNDDEKDTFQTGSISYVEGKRIHKNWKKFSKMFEVPNTPICLARWRNKEKSRKPTTADEIVRRFVISFLAQGLERNLYQVYKYVVTHYGCLKKGKFSKHEENIINVCVYHSPKNAVPNLSAVLSREPRGIYKKILEMSNGKREKKALKWTLPLATKFLNLLMQYTGESEVENLKQRQFERSVWIKLEKDIDQYYIYLQQFWHYKLHVQLFVKADVKIKKLRKMLFKILRLYPYKVWTDIRWKDVAKHFPDGFSHRFLYKICYNLIYKSLPGFLKLPLEDVIEFGLARSKKYCNRRLKTLIFNENHELEPIKYDNKLANVYSKSKTIFSQ